MRKTVSSLPWIRDQQAACQAEGKEAGEAKRAAEKLYVLSWRAELHAKTAPPARPIFTTQPFQKIFTNLKAIY